MVGPKKITQKEGKKEVTEAMGFGRNGRDGRVVVVTRVSDMEEAKDHMINPLRIKWPFELEYV